MKHSARRNSAAIAVAKVGAKVGASGLKWGPSVGRAAAAKSPGFWRAAGRTVSGSPTLAGILIGGSMLIAYWVYSSVQQATHNKWFLLVKDNFLPITLILIAVVFLILSGKKGGR